MGTDTFIIETTTGKRLVSKGDWVIKDAFDTFYTCKPDIFEKTYEGADSIL